LPVKPLSPIHVLLASLVTGLGLSLIWWSNSSDQDGHIDSFGNAMAASLANQVVEPFAAKDLIYLGVLANRTIELPEVVGAAVYTVDDDLVTLTGDVSGGRPFTRPIVRDGAIVGYVRVHIDEADFSEPLHPGLIVASLLWMLLIPAAVIWSDPLIGSTSARRRSTMRDIGPIPEASADDADRADAGSLDYLITINLFNQLSLTPDQCRRELEFARATALPIADLYHAEVEPLPGTGLVLVLHPTDSDDRPFHVICAAYALSGLFERVDSWGRYRFGVHVRDHETAAVDQTAVADAAVLSALAGDNAVVVSDALYERMPYPERVVCDSLVHPLIDELSTIGGRAHLVRRLADPHQDLVDQQVRELSYSERSTASESTF
jgi:uncharacterized membrane protein affecting hemolysin expression